MVSLLHEGVIRLVRDRPAFAADLLGDVLKLDLPRFSGARLVDGALNELAPVEYRADAVVVFSRKKPVFGVIIEAQLGPDKVKRFTWPLYAVGARARERCPFVVLVVTPSAATARWASGAIELGGGNRYRPLVVGPDGIPKLTDQARARREPQLAILSVMAHGRGEVETAAAIGAAAVRAILPLPEEQQLLYSLLIDANLSEAARKAIEMEPGLEKFFSIAQRRTFERGRAEGKAEGLAEGKAEGLAEGKAEGLAEGKAEGLAEGKAEGKADALLTILMRRGLTPNAAQHRRIIECIDLATLEHWLDAALSARSVEAVLASSPRAASGARRRSRAEAASRRSR